MLVFNFLSITYFIFAFGSCAFIFLHSEHVFCALAAPTNAASVDEAFVPRIQPNDAASVDEALGLSAAPANAASVDEALAAPTNAASVDEAFGPRIQPNDAASVDEAFGTTTMITMENDAVDKLIEFSKTMRALAMKKLKEALN